jgi:hypothetical protein
MFGAAAALEFRHQNSIHLIRGFSEHGIGVLKLAPVTQGKLRKRDLSLLHLTLQTLHNVLASQSLELEIMRSLKRLFDPLGILNPTRCCRRSTIQRGPRHDSSRRSGPRL